VLRKLIHAGLDSAERTLRVPGSMEYLRAVAGHSRGAFLKFSLFLPLATHRRRLPSAAYHAARLAATRHQDCGTCVQIVVNQARSDGVPAPLLRALLHDRPDDVPPEVAEAYRFARAVVEQAPDAESLREQVRARFGEEGLVELALGIASAQVFPVAKRALGYATSCTLASVELET